ncbi:hypothetical protein BUALT_Bualt18G0015600 [Buddleja alternifolia]|uniref:Transposase n=1 Tax=Buddleja alternifolia TaxID=168488 RepID=A0AAV6W845_9LAMI|nr:hypothetical protein BUALT_Bualt18G0015600 [Buddleja alternifolia]
MANKKVVGSQEHKTFNEEETRRELAMMVILYDYPLSIVDRVGFRRFVASFKSSFQVMSRNTLKNDIMKIYSNERVKCYNLLEKLKCRIAITTDMWTSSNNKKGFMAITGHYIDDSWVLQSCILRLHPSTVEALMCSPSWLWKEANGTCPTFGDLSTCPTILDEEEDTVEEEDDECGVEQLS